MVIAEDNTSTGGEEPSRDVQGVRINCGGNITNVSVERVTSVSMSKIDFKKLTSTATSKDGEISEPDLPAGPAIFKLMGLDTLVFVHTPMEYNGEQSALNKNQLPTSLFIDAGRESGSWGQVLPRWQNHTGSIALFREDKKLLEAKQIGVLCNYHSERIVKLFEEY